MIIADWSVEKINSDMVTNRMLLDINALQKKKSKTFAVHDYVLNICIYSRFDKLNISS
jgi:hypothetical protein